MHELLIIFTRYPEPGKTKTRLIPVLGPDGAADLQRRMTERTVAWARNLACSDGGTLEIRYEGGSEDQFRGWLGPELPCRPQGVGDLGRRMSRAFLDAFQDGRERVVLIGTDCPGLSEDLARKAIAELSNHDMVLGPANDGGYYLIGLRRPVPGLFEKIAWGTGEVLRATLEIADRLQLRTFLLEALDDVDRPEDLGIWDRSLNDRAKPGKISIIIPTLQEEENIAECLLSTGQGRDVETIVVDGGSTDRTVEIARARGARVFKCAKGRGVQMNAGAREASGEILIFLHADTRLPAGFDGCVRETLQKPGIAAGAFEFRLDRTSPSLRFIERVANWRSRRLQLPYGDQAIFLRAELFREIGGYAEIPIMEDVEMIRRLQKKGRIETVRSSAVTSARRWRQFGVWKTTLINELALAAYYLGISPLRIYSLRRTQN